MVSPFFTTVLGDSNSFFDAPVRLNIEFTGSMSNNLHPSCNTTPVDASSVRNSNSNCNAVAARFLFEVVSSMAMSFCSLTPFTYISLKLSSQYPKRRLGLLVTVSSKSFTTCPTVAVGFCNISIPDAISVKSFYPIAKFVEGVHFPFFTENPMTFGVSLYRIVN